MKDDFGKGKDGGFNVEGDKNKMEQTKEALQGKPRAICECAKIETAICRQCFQTHYVIVCVSENRCPKLRGIPNYVDGECFLDAWKSP